MSKPGLTHENFVAAARELNCPVAAIKAVFEVEAAGRGFYSDGVPRTLFEGHKFFVYTKGKYQHSHPHLCYPTWTKKFYGKTEAEERGRLAEASSLDRTAALLSTSWGLPQIMGFNYAAAGHKTLQSFVNAMYKDSNSHLQAFVALIKTFGLADELQRQDWNNFARVYNGPGQVSVYAPRMAKAFAKHSAV